MENSHIVEMERLKRQYLKDFRTWRQSEYTKNAFDGVLAHLDFMTKYGIIKDPDILAEFKQLKQFQEWFNREFRSHTEMLPQHKEKLTRIIDLVLSKVS